VYNHTRYLREGSGMWRSGRSHISLAPTRCAPILGFSSDAHLEINFSYLNRPSLSHFTGQKRVNSEDIL
jgi:hypothetical protein